VYFDPLATHPCPLHAGQTYIACDWNSDIREKCYMKDIAEVGRESGEGEGKEEGGGGGGRRGREKGRRRRGGREGGEGEGKEEEGEEGVGREGEEEGSTTQWEYLLAVNGWTLLVAVRNLHSVFALPLCTQLVWVDEQLACIPCRKW
jgi:hypothetical protein